MQQRSMKPSLDVPYNWKYALTPDNEFRGDFFIPSKNVSLSATTITDSFPSESSDRPFLKPAANLLDNSYSSKFCTSLRTTSDPHHHVKVRNNHLFLAHPCEPEYTLMLQTQTFPPQFQQLPTDHEDLAYHHQNQNKGPSHLELLEDVVAGNFASAMTRNKVSATGTAQPVDPQLDSSHYGLIIRNNENFRPDEICDVTKGFISSNEERFDHNHSISGTEVPNKPRIRWTQELHECFMQVVTDLGGADSEGMHDSEVLRMQWELQKNLHDQLEFQRELQLRAEANAQQLQKLLEEQKRVGQAFVLASQSVSPTCSSATSLPPPTSPTTNIDFPRKGEILHDSLLLDNNDHSFLPSSQKRARLRTDQDPASQALKRVHS
ncbi:hypothetical protein Syun_026696 [Stephania yunnanensis]|uniref:MYB-CC type transcription factor LHEQLE-containing domain-containing protein n=1 Tax=Stephania yunnanensis TaxID=152371 RepID=A0AAP0EU01_9MAGN